MNWFSKKGKEIDKMPINMEPSEFLLHAVEFLHNEALKKGFAQKGFILNEGLLSVGTPSIIEGLKSEPQKTKRTNSFYLSLAASNLQTGIIFARALCTNRQDFISGIFFEKHDSIESMYNELLIALKEDLHITIQEWNSFREFIVPKLLSLLAPYSSLKNVEIYQQKALTAYYLLGVSIGLEKYE